MPRSARKPYGIHFSGVIRARSLVRITGGYAHSHKIRPYEALARKRLETLVILKWQSRNLT